MAVEIREDRVLSADRKTQLYCKVYIPEGERKGVLQVVHGMTEYIGRYDSFMRKVAEAGYLCFGHDHLGHGQSAPDDESLGFIASENGDRLLVEDVHTVYTKYSAEFSFKERFLLGHSMGSFVVRIYTMSHGDTLSGAIYMGTGGKNPASSLGMSLAKCIRKIKGEKYRSKFLENLMFGLYNKKTEKITGKDWLTKDADIQKKYIADKYCMYMFTMAADIDLLNLLIRSNSDEFYSSVPKDLPIYVVSGSDDPVGEYGKGPKEVSDGLIKSGHKDVTLKLWDGDRHEVLNETDKEKVISELMGWIESKNIK